MEWATDSQPHVGIVGLITTPLNAAEKIDVQYGGASAMWGSGAVGGMIAMENVRDTSNQFHIKSQSSIGSFGNRHQALQLGIGNGRFQSKTKFSYQEADNDFWYEIHPDLPKRQQTNALLLQYNLLQDFYYSLSSNQSLSTHIWWQNSNRQIPPTIVQNESQAYQEDRALRLAVNWQNIGERAIWRGKIGYFKEYLNYYDEQILFTALSDFSTWLGEFDGQFSIGKNGKHQLAFGTTHSLSKAFADGYRAKHPVQEYRAALFGSFRSHFANWTTQFSLRQEMVSGRLIPLVPILAANHQIGKHLEIKGKISRDYRLPTLNDRFWQPGGNPNLLAESGWSEEATLFGKHKTSPKTSKVDLHSRVSIET